MGIRSFDFQILVCCIHLIYNHISCINLCPSSPNPTPNHIHSDAHVTIYHRPTLASLPLRKFLKHLICDSDSFLGQPIPALSASDTLQLGRNYFLLPSHLLLSVLSFLTLTSFASRHHALKSATCNRPLDILKTVSSSVQIGVSDEFIQSLMVRKERKDDDDDDDDDGEAGKKRLCSTPKSAAGEPEKKKLQAIGSPCNARSCVCVASVAEEDGATDDWTVSGLPYVICREREKSWPTKAHARIRSLVRR